jgi:DUF1016 N-terminal domain
MAKKHNPRKQAGKERASHGKRVLQGLAERLQVEFGKGYYQSNLRNMRAFFLTYPIRDALRHELFWTSLRPNHNAGAPMAHETARTHGELSGAVGTWPS